MTGIGEDKSTKSPENILRSAGLTSDSDSDKDFGEFVSGLTNVHEVYSLSDMTILYMCVDVVIIAFVYLVYFVEDIVYIFA